MKNIILTIDVGTGSTRVALMATGGNILAFEQFEYDQITEHLGWAAQAPSRWWNAAKQGITKLLRDHNDIKNNIIAICSCGQMHGTVFLDDSGNLAVDQALLWNDKRSEPQVESFIAGHNIDDYLHKFNNPPTSAWPAFKILWVQENWPDIWQKTRMMLMPKDFINYKLCGAYATDYSEASCFYLMDQGTLAYDETFVQSLNIKMSQLPPIFDAQHILGHTSKELEAETRLPSGIPVLVGTSDFAASLLGSGVYKLGTASDSTGTSTLITVVNDRPLASLQFNNFHLSNKAWGVFSILDAGGDAMRWARLTFHENKKTYQNMVDMAKEVKVGADNLFFLPYLTGERNGAYKNAKAQFFGLTRGHRMGHLHRAILEGVAYSASMNLDEIQRLNGNNIDYLIASGGGAKDLLWLQIKADIYNKPIIQTQNSENGSMGCYILAALATGLYANLDETVEKNIVFGQKIQPNPINVDFYQRGKSFYKKLYAQAQSLYPLLDELG